MPDKYETTCPCGSVGHASYREKDNPYSSYGIWTFTGFDCVATQVERPVAMSLAHAVEEAIPTCPECGRAIQASAFKELT